MNSKNEKREIAYDYWDLIQSVMLIQDSANPLDERHFSYYCLNQKRIELHDKLCEALGLSKEETQTVTDNIDQCDDFDDFYHRLISLIMFKKPLKEMNYYDVKIEDGDMLVGAFIKFVFVLDKLGKLQEQTTDFHDYKYQVLKKEDTCEWFILFRKKEEASQCTN